MAAITQEQFEREYAERAGLTVERLREYRAVRPCDCDYDLCQGWQMVSHLEAACIDAAARAGVSPMEWEQQFFDQYHRLPELSDFTASDGV